MTVVAEKHTFMRDDQVRPKCDGLPDHILRGREGRNDSLYPGLQVSRFQLVHGLFRAGDSSR
ncbi:hypothetical protein D3C81_2235310 [compost metagenome]